MNENEIKEKVDCIVLIYMKQKKIVMEEALNMTDVLVIDSISAMGILVEIEEEFSIEFAENEIGMDLFNNFANLIAMTTDKIREKEAKDREKK